MVSSKVEGRSSWPLNELCQQLRICSRGVFALTRVCPEIAIRPAQGGLSAIIYDAGVLRELVFLPDVSHRSGSRRSFALGSSHTLAVVARLSGGWVLHTSRPVCPRMAVGALVIASAFQAGGGRGALPAHRSPFIRNPSPLGSHSSLLDCLSGRTVSGARQAGKRFSEEQQRKGARHRRGAHSSSPPPGPGVLGCLCL